MADEYGYLMLVSSAIKAEDWSWYWSWILIKISVRDLIRFTRSFFFWWEHSTHWSVALLPIFKVALTRETILTGNHLHGPKWEHTLLVEEDPRLLLVLFPLHYVQERGRPLVRNLGKIYFLPKFADSWKNSCEHFTFILTLGSTWDMFMDLPPADGSNCQRAWDFFYRHWGANRAKEDLFG